jgi:hypothetical protein
MDPQPLTSTVFPLISLPQMRTSTGQLKQSKSRDTAMADDVRAVSLKGRLMSPATRLHIPIWTFNTTHRHWNIHLLGQKKRFVFEIAPYHHSSHTEALGMNRHTYPYILHRQMYCH